MPDSLKECSCSGSNPNCVLCNGFGMIRPEDKIHAPLIPQRFEPSKQKHFSPKSKSPQSRCPYCRVLVNKLTKHIKKVHHENLIEHQNQQTTGMQVKRKAIKVITPPTKKKQPVPTNKSLSQPIIDLASVSDKKTLKKLGFLICNKCGEKFRDGLYAEHCRQKHNRTNKGGNKTGVRRIVKTVQDNQAVQNTPAVQAKIKEKPKIKYVGIANKEGFRYSDLKECAACGSSSKSTWRFMTTAGKDVFICSKCKPAIFEYSFGKKDALDYAVLGGMFEGNRRRH